MLHLALHLAGLHPHCMEVAQKGQQDHVNLQRQSAVEQIIGSAR